MQSFGEGGSACGANRVESQMELLQGRLGLDKSLGDGLDPLILQGGVCQIQRYQLPLPSQHFSQRRTNLPSIEMGMSAGDFLLQALYT